MKEATDLGTNKTGLHAAPVLAKEMVRSSHEEMEEPAPDGTPARELRLGYAQASPPLGTVPPPMSVKGVATSAVEALRGNKATVLVDKLAERLAFERTGVRLYEALLLKWDAKRRSASGPTREQLAEIREDEMRHFALVYEALKRVGGDPTAQTPSADLEGVASLGLVQILADPRTSLREGLQAILHAEAADRDGWELLVSLAEGFGQDELAASFQEALRTEERHLIRVRGWVAAMTRDLAFGEDEGPEPERTSAAAEQQASERREARTSSPRRASGAGGRSRAGSASSGTGRTERRPASKRRGTKSGGRGDE